MSLPQTARAVFLAILLAGVTACGSSDQPTSQQAERHGTDSATSSGSSSSGSSEDRWPRCADVWQVGKALPAGYTDTCNEKNGTTVTGEGYECADGSHIHLYSGPQRLYALPDEVIRTMSNDEFVRYLVETCRP